MAHWLKDYTESAFKNIQDTNWIDEKYAEKLTKKFNKHFNTCKTVEEVKELIQFANYMPNSLLWVIVQDNKRFLEE